MCDTHLLDATHFDLQHTGNSLANPIRLAESAAINKSLSTLGQVVHALNTGAVSGLLFSRLRLVLIDLSYFPLLPSCVF